MRSTFKELIVRKPAVKTDFNSDARFKSYRFFKKETNIIKYAEGGDQVHFKQLTSAAALPSHILKDTDRDRKSTRLNSSH